MRGVCRAGGVLAAVVIGLAASGAPAQAEEKCGTLAGDAPGLAAAWQDLESACGCAPPASEDWKPEYKSFVGCARTHALQAVLDQTIRSKCRTTLIAAAKKSTCFHPPEWTTCCYTNKKSRLSCKLRKTEEKCATTSSKFAELGTTATCLDACEDASGPACWVDSECDDGDPCTIDWCEPAEACNNLPIPGCTPGNGGSGGTSCTGNGNPTHGLSPSEDTLLQLVNDYRASQGQSPVTICSSLNVSAQDHANDMRNRGYFSHVGHNGSEFWERACDAGYTNGCVPSTWMGEIVAGYDSTPSGVMNQWLGSPGHEFIMASPNHIVAGIGQACGGPMGNYWVMDFAGADEPSCD